MRLTRLDCSQLEFNHRVHIHARDQNQKIKVACVEGAKSVFKTVIRFSWSWIYSWLPKVKRGSPEFNEHTSMLGIVSLQLIEFDSFIRFDSFLVINDKALVFIFFANHALGCWPRTAPSFSKTLGTISCPSLIGRSSGWQQHEAPGIPDWMAPSLKN